MIDEEVEKLKALRLLPLLVILAMLFAACAPTTGNSDLLATQAPGAEGGDMGTPAAGDESGAEEGVTTEEPEATTAPGAGDETPGVTEATTEPSETEGAEATQATGQEVPDTGGDVALAEASRVSKLIGYRVFSQDGDDLGSITDLVIHAPAAMLEYALVQPSQADAEGQLVPIPWSQLEINPGTVEVPSDATHTLVFKADMAAFEGAPTVASESVDTDLAAWISEASQYWSQYSESGANRPELDETSAVRASALLNTNIEAGALGEIGGIEDVIVDPLTGSIQYVVLSTGEALNMGTRLIPIPINILTFNPDTGSFSLNVDPELLANAPSFDPGALPDLLGEEFGTGVREFWESQ
ncbi:MAG: PRC-barrel domain containing protein [Chloroflexota bacterium]|nr:MAG: PRC-barrel domain containing protein [Chloroflexota bacterium]